MSQTVRRASRDEEHSRESALQLHDQRMQIQEVAGTAVPDLKLN